jgi:hypothetical protein
LILEHTARAQAHPKALASNDHGTRTRKARGLVVALNPSGSGQVVAPRGIEICPYLCRDPVSSEGSGVVRVELLAGVRGAGAERRTETNKRALTLRPFSSVNASSSSVGP